MSRLALVYEIGDNPLFNSAAPAPPDRLSEFAKPSEIDDLLTQLKYAGHEVTIVDGPGGILQQREQLAQSGTLIFNKSIGFGGLERKIHVPSICLLFGLPIIGSGAYSMTLARHKFHTNRLLLGLGYSVPRAVLRTVSNRPSLRSLRFPVIVKPNHESDSIGIDEQSIVSSEAEAESRAASLMERFNQPIIVEEFIAGEEWKVPVIGNGAQAEAVGCVSVTRNGTPIEGSLQTRSDVVHATLGYHPATGSQVHRALQIASDIHRDLGLRDYSRCDFRIDSNDALVCMEVSTHPDISSTSSFMAAATRDRTVPEVLDEIVRAANRRYESCGPGA